jgi:hypothetical protein
MKFDRESIRKRDLDQVGRDLIRDRDYTVKNANEALIFLEQLEEKWSNKIGRRLLALLNRLGGIDRDIMECLLLPDTKKKKNDY